MNRSEAEIIEEIFRLGYYQTSNVMGKRKEQAIISVVKQFFMVCNLIHIYKKSPELDYEMIVIQPQSESYHPEPEIGKRITIDDFVSLVERPEKD